jgi:zinc protease
MMTMTYPARIFATIVVWLSVTAAHAFEVREIRSMGGIDAWLVEDKTIPLIAINFAFGRGTISDLTGKEGTANFLTGMLDEGAADLDGPAFQAMRDNLAIKLSFNATPDRFYGTLQTLSPNRKDAFTLLRKAITSPRLDPDAVERMREVFVLNARNNEKNPQQIANRQWLGASIPGHPYTRLSEGSPESVMVITREDLANSHSAIFSRSGLKVVAVGDIEAAELAEVLDQIFGQLPVGQPPVAVAEASVTRTAVQKTILFDIPQTIIMFGQQGILQNDPFYFASLVMSEILGGDTTRAWLNDEVREKRGLTYGIGYNLVPLPSAGLYVGSLSTANEKAGEAVQAVKSTLRRMAELGPTQQELDNAKSFLTGSYALRFDSNEKIANVLMAMQLTGRPSNFANIRNELIDGVTLQQVKDQARKLLKPDSLVIVAVGKPVGLD